MGCLGAKPPPGRRSLVRALFAGLICTLGLPTAATGGADEAAVERLIRQGIRQNFESRLDAADATWAELRETSPRSPAGWVYAVDTCWWREMYGGDRVELGARIRELAERGLELARARLEEDPDEARDHFYAGLALMQLARLEGSRNRPIRAGSLGEKGRDQLERALELRPNWTDAKYQLGLYYYYASILPDLFSWLSFLWFVPKGDGPTGLAYLDEVARDGIVHRHDAVFMLGNIRAYHEPERPSEGLELYQPLLAEFPGNTVIHLEVVEMLYDARRYREVIELARELRESEAAESGYDLRKMAPIWQARAELEQGKPVEAWQTLEPIEADAPQQPPGGTAWVFLVRGQIKDVLGDRDGARSYYQRVQALEPPRRQPRTVRLAEAWLEEPYVLSLPQITARE